VVADKAVTAVEINLAETNLAETKVPLDKAIKIKNQRRKILNNKNN
jgi:hypothetical protein